MAVLDRTRELWERQDRAVGDRRPLYAAVAHAFEVRTVLYPGSYVDLAPSFVWPDVTYVDVDRRAARFFGDEPGVRALIAERGGDGDAARFRFLPADYREPLELDEGAFDLLISLYAGPISEHATHHLRLGGLLLVNPSHGDAALASIDDRYRLVGAVIGRSGRYRVDTEHLEDHLVPKRDVEVTRELVHRTGRGIAYTKAAFAYLFERVA